MRPTDSSIWASGPSLLACYHLLPITGSMALQAPSVCSPSSIHLLAIARIMAFEAPSICLPFLHSPVAYHRQPGSSWQFVDEQHMCNHKGLHDFCPLRSPYALHMCSCTMQFQRQRAASCLGRFRDGVYQYCRETLHGCADCPQKVLASLTSNAGLV